MNKRLHETPSATWAAPIQHEVDVLVVGAGPTGLTAACEALRHGLSVRIIDLKEGRSTHSKALVTHARTLEVFETMGAAEAMLAKGVPFAALNTRSGPTGPGTRVDLLGLPWGDTAYPFWLSIPQDDTELVLEELLTSLGGAVEWATALEAIQDEGPRVQALLKHEDRTETVFARWVVGCDGGRSCVREQTGITLKRHDARATFVLADVKSRLPMPQNEGHAYLAPQGLLLIVPMPEPDRWRIIAHVPRTPSDSPVRVDEDFLDELIRQRSGLEFGSHEVKWTSQFNLSHGLADRYREGRVFLAGDAAHVHSPVGGQGLNTGVQDAHNLLWKLAMAERAGTSRAAEMLLDSYEEERRPVARSMVAGVARVTSVMTTRRSAIRRVLGRLSPLLLSRPGIQAKLGRATGMLELGYSNGFLANGSDAGHRLANPELPEGGCLYDRLPRTGWAWIVSGEPGEITIDHEDSQWRGIPVIFLPHHLPTDGATGVSLDSRVVLVRPDRYVAGSGPTPQDAAHPDNVVLQGLLSQVH